ncbi:uncharacterized protein LOC135815378 isoform X1 [Sycon ciliatum]|uniref:uncharacterized protein LOC135815378 isoform X1 n=1 Tax=Sycon ciliatum TaxID=27933 RepID=UPI0031F60946
MPSKRWRVGEQQDALSSRKVAVRVERNESTTGWNHPLHACPVKLAMEEDARVKAKRHSQSQQLSAFQESVSQRVSLLRKVKQQAELCATESEVQRRDNFIEQNIVMAHNPGRFNSLQVRVNRQHTRQSAPAPALRGDSLAVHQQSVPPTSTVIDAATRVCTQQPRASLRERATQICSMREKARQLLLSQPLASGTGEDRDEEQTGICTPRRLTFEQDQPTFPQPASVPQDPSVVEAPLVDVSATVHVPAGVRTSVRSANSHASVTRNAVDTDNASKSEQTRPTACLVSHVRPIHLAAVVPKSPALESRVPVSRRLFMDLERAQVQEKRRQRQLQQQVNRVVQHREYERYELEVQDQIDKGHDPPVQLQAGGCHNQHEGGMVERSEATKTASKQLNMARYLDALRERVRQRSQHIALPPICGCADAAWLSHPDTCASNCPFHHNPHGKNRNRRQGQVWPGHSFLAIVSPIRSIAVMRLSQSQTHASNTLKREV